ncbi:MBL fold metallo-hydrolase [Alkalicoccus daliensis]|uniref:Metal-dependent hydrolase, beta-lactamase superfamily II n=1 Tax=Alkalicoccus daliensis TaxID=745820 RepID=A0A1G9ZN81_9BACI|nr:MBL fold metallo-hydrolase [Alkalicoccus daliensis]SDN22694.1 Metal-dependent hydrolase, beta-lactamase superfamily II [Alkalicoccus daliensis]
MKLRLYSILMLFLIIMLTSCGTAGSNSDQSAQEQISSEQENHPDNSPQEIPEEENNASENLYEYHETDFSEAGELTVHFINAGQADATLFIYESEIRTYQVLFDTGDWNNTLVIDYLEANEIDYLDILISSHPHADHIGQMDLIINALDVNEVWMSGAESDSDTYERVLDTVLASEAAYEEPRAGDSYELGSFSIDILHPASLSGDLNEDSLAAKFMFGETSFLLTGDGETHAETSMLHRSDNLEADVLQLGHHGSNTSTSEEFLEAVNPDIAVISAGENNSYGHPHTEVIERVENEAIDLYGTYVHGHIIITSDGNNVTVSTETDGNVTAQESEQKNENNPQNNENINPIDCIDINKADKEELEQIIHIGEERAADIIDARPFQYVSDLTAIHGISESRLSDIKNQGEACVAD